MIKKNQKCNIYFFDWSLKITDLILNTLIYVCNISNRLTMSMINGVEEIIYKNQSLDFERNKFVTVVTYEALEVCGGAL